ncbi:MAG: phage integrase family protein [Myxococcales bacterium]|nr:phage integrase family protein [Myxococcales bacterium]
MARGTVGINEPDDSPRFKTLFDQFLDGLTNRNAGDDRSRGRRHLVPKFARLRLMEVSLATVMEWIDEQRAAGELSESSIRHNMNLLSRFFSWAVARGKASINPVRQIPMGSRPTQTVKSDTRWIDDDAIVRKLIADIEEPIHFMFYLGNRSGLRTGEAAGLRMSDFAFLEEGVIRVRFSYDGPLKEDKKGSGKVKWVPAPEDCAEFLGPWLAQRKAQCRSGGSRVPVRAAQRALLPQGIHRSVLGGGGAEARRCARGLAQEEEGQDRERSEATPAARRGYRSRPIRRLRPRIGAQVATPGATDLTARNACRCRFVRASFKRSADSATVNAQVRNVSRRNIVIVAQLFHGASATRVKDVVDKRVVLVDADDVHRELRDELRDARR